MKKVILMAAVLLLAACSTQKEKRDAETQAAAMTDSLRQVIEQKDNELNDIVSTLNEVQEGFRQINEAEGRIKTENTGGETSGRQAIMENMAFIQRTLKLNAELISNLKQQLRNATASNRRLKATIEETLANFTAQIEEKNREIAALKAELEQKAIVIADQGAAISDLHYSVSDLASANSAQSGTIAAQDKQLHAAWYVFGTKKELREQNILKSGEVLREDDYNKDYFTAIDVRVTKTIKLYSRSAKLMTTHPEGSYSLDKDAQGNYTLRVLDVEKFWSVSRYLVVLVK